MTKLAYHVVCHDCPYEEVIAGDRVLAAATKLVHGKREPTHAVEYGAIGEVPR